MDIVTAIELFFCGILLGMIIRRIVVHYLLEFKILFIKYPRLMTYIVEVFS